MGGDLDHSDFVDPDYPMARRPAPGSPAVTSIGSAPATGKPPSPQEIHSQVTAAQQALVELKRRQEELERERTHLEEARRRRLEYQQGREEMLVHLTRGIGLLEEAEQSARRDAEQLARTLGELREAIEKVSSLNEESWTAENYGTELTRALTTLENARLEWNSAQLKWPQLTANALDPNAAATPTDGPERGVRLLEGRPPAELARLGLALTWPVAIAVLVSGLVLAIVLSRR